jgi:hypothetical protein
MAVLPDLTDQYLKGPGVSLGHRLKMLRAIRDLGNAPCRNGTLDTRGDRANSAMTLGAAS